MNDPQALIGQQIDQYQIIQHLASGGMADVYRAVDVRLQREVALKVMHAALAAQESFRRRFLREARAVANITHGHVIEIYTVGSTPDERPYFTMPYILSGSLRNLLDTAQKMGRTVPAVQALQIMRAVAEALQAAHAKNIVHRDLKPANILLRAPVDPVVTDFGIAAIRDEATRLTQMGARVGTPRYMSPEQKMARQVDARADLYTVGLIVFELLTGELPAPPETAVTQLRQLRPDLSSETAHVIDQCLQTAPDARFGSAAALIEALNMALYAEGDTRTGTRPVAQPHGGRRRWLWLGMGLMALLLVGGGSLLWANARPAATPTPDPAAIAAAEPTETATGLAASPTPPPVVTAVYSPTPTATHTPTPTATPTATPTPTPTVTPTPTLRPFPGVVAAPPTGRIVFSCYNEDAQDDICLINADGSGERLLYRSTVTDFYATFTRDGEQILFSSRKDGQFALYIINADGSGEPALFAPPEVGAIYASDLSPDGRQLIFTAANGGAQHIWRLDRETGTLTQLTTEGLNNQDPVWSPDGRFIAFASDRDGGVRHYVMDADGGSVREVGASVAQQGGRSDWSPDGRWLAFYAGPNEARQIYIAAVDGDTVYQLTDQGSNLAPSFSPDGSWIVFTSYRSGNHDLFIMRLDGSGLTRLTTNASADWQPRWER